MARKRRVSWLSVFYFLVILGALVGGSVWLDRKGEQVVAKVTSKTEEITVTHDPQGGWYRYFRVGAEFDAAGALMSATVTGKPQAELWLAIGQANRRATISAANVRARIASSSSSDNDRSMCQRRRSSTARRRCWQE
jgi:hypothetical protein